MHRRIPAAAASSSATASSSSHHFAPPRLNMNEMQLAARLLDDCVSRSRTPCRELLSSFLTAQQQQRWRYAAAANRGAASDAGFVALSSKDDATVAFGAADLLNKAGEWSRALELIGACHELASASSNSSQIRIDARNFFRMLRSKRGGDDDAKDEAEDRQHRDDNDLRNNRNNNNNDARTQQQSFKLQGNRRMSPGTTPGLSSWEPEPQEAPREEAAECVQRINEHVARAQAVLHEQERLVFLTQSEQQYRIDHPTLSEQDSLRDDKERRRRHAEFANCVSAALEEVRTSPFMTKSVSDAGQQNQPRLAQWVPFFDSFTSIVQLCKRCHSLQDALANRQRDAVAGDVINVSDDEQQTVLRPSKRQSMWRTDPFWPTLSIDVLLVRLLFEVPPVLRRMITHAREDQNQKNVAEAISKSKNLKKTQQQQSASQLAAATSSSLDSAAAVESALDAMLEKAEEQQEDTAGDEREQQQQQAATIARNVRSEEVGRLFFRAFVVEPELAVSAIRALQKHHGRELLDGLLVALTDFVSAAAEAEQRALQQSLSPEIDDTPELLERVQARSPNGAALWPFLGKLIALSLEADSKAVFVRIDKRFAPQGFTADWVTSAIHSGSDNNNRNHNNSAEESRKLQRELQNNANRAGILLDLATSLAWQTLFGVVTGQSTLNAARVAAAPAVRRLFELCAALPVFDVSRCLPLMFVASQGLQITAWGGNMKLPLARFLWFSPRAAELTPTIKAMLRVSSNDPDGAPVPWRFRSDRDDTDYADDDREPVEGEVRHDLIAPPRAAVVCHKLYGALQQSRRLHHGIKQQQRPQQQQKKTARLSSFGSALLPSALSSSSSWQCALQVLAPLTPSNGFSPLHQKYTMLACADAGQSAVGLHLYTRHSRSVPLSQTTVCILLDFIKHGQNQNSDVDASWTTAVQLVVEAHIASSAANSRPSKAVMMRLCDLVAKRAPQHEAMRFFHSLVREGAMNNAVNNCGPSAFAPFLESSARSGRWYDAIVVVSELFSRGRFFEVDQLAAIPRYLAPSWKEVTAVFLQQQRQKQQQQQQQQQHVVPKEVRGAVAIATSAFTGDVEVCRAVLRACVAARLAAASDLKQPSSQVRLDVHALCVQPELAAAGAEDDGIGVRTVERATRTGF